LEFVWLLYLVSLVIELMIIKNYKELATTESRKNILDIIEAGLESVSPEKLMRNTVKYNLEFNSVIVHNTSYDLFRGRIFVIGGGKAAGYMAEAFEKIVGPQNITAGVVNCTEGDYNTKKIELVEAGHPLPDKRGVKGVEKMLALKDKFNIGEKDLVVCLLSGGASALMPSSVSNFDLTENQMVTQKLIQSGADINEINIIRKHLSKVKGGRLANYFNPTKVLSIIISDVAGNNLETIASGPTVADHSTFSDAYEVLKKFNLLEKIPDTIKAYIIRGCEGKEEESPKIISNANNYIIGDSAVALEAMALKAKSLNYKPIIVDTNIIGEPQIAAEKIAQDIKSGNYEGYQVLLFAGETTPSIPEKHGTGGRNQHFSALSLVALNDLNTDWIMASINSDGIDFTRDAAGALVDKSSCLLAEKIGINIDNYINNFDSYNLYKKLGNNLITTGLTGTNVGDLMIYVIK
jgi:glycerate 2-kinase